MNIPFIQVLRPDGRPRPYNIDRPEDVANRAKALIGSGYQFHIEELSTGVISMTCFDPEEEIDFAIELCNNGPEVPSAVDKLVAQATEFQSLAGATP